MNPTTAESRLDLSVTSRALSEKLILEQFSAARVAPILNVNEFSASFRHLPANFFLTPPEDTEVSPSGEARELTTEWEQKAYQLRRHKVEEGVADEDIRMYGDELRAEQMARNRSLIRLLTALEKKVAVQLTTAGNYTGQTTAANVPWSTTATADPIKNVFAAKQAFKNRNGIFPNLLAIPAEARDSMMQCTLFLNRFVSNSNMNPLNPAAAQYLAELFGIPNIVILDAPKNTAGHGQTATFGQHWLKTVVGLGLISTADDLSEPCHARIVVKDFGGVPAPNAQGSNVAIVVDQYREEKRERNIIRARCHYQFLEIQAAFWQLITDVL